MRYRNFWIFVSEAWQSALGCSLMRYRLFFNALYKQPRALCHASLTKIQKCLQRIFATLYFVRSFFDDLFLQRFILRAVFLTIHFCNNLFCGCFFLLQKQIVRKSPHKKFLHIYFCTSFFCIFIFVYLIKMTI